MISTRSPLLYVLFSIMTFIFLSMQYDSSLIHIVDNLLISTITNTFSEKWIDFFTLVTDIGSYDVTLPLLFLLSVGLLLSRQYILFVIVVINFYGVRHLNSFLKELFERDRPSEIYRLVEAHNFSFPSGHSMNSMAFYGLLCWLLLQLPLFQKSIPKYLLLLCFSCLILSIGISRIYLRVHFPTDVIAGFLAGSAWFISLILLYRYFIQYVLTEVE